MSNLVQPGLVANANAKLAVEVSNVIAPLEKLYIEEKFCYECKCQNVTKIMTEDQREIMVNRVECPNNTDCCPTNGSLEVSGSKMTVATDHGCACDCSPAWDLVGKTGKVSTVRRLDGCCVLRRRVGGNAGNHVFVVEQDFPVTCCRAPFGEDPYLATSDGKVTAHIKKLPRKGIKAILSEALTGANHFDVRFVAPLTPEQKMAYLTSVFCIDYTWYRPKNNDGQ